MADTERSDFEGNPGFLDLPPLANAPELGAPEPEQPKQVADETPPEPVFPPEVADAVEGLLFLGHLTSGFDLMGHRFEIRTLKAGEELAIGQIVQEYEGRLGSTKAYAIAIAAACISSVDGRPLTAPLGPSGVTDAIRRDFDYIARSWYYPVVEMVYDHYSALVLQQNAAFTALQGKSEAGRRKS